MLCLCTFRNKCFNVYWKNETQIAWSGCTYALVMTGTMTLPTCFVQEGRLQENENPEKEAANSSGILPSSSEDAAKNTEEKIEIAGKAVGKGGFWRRLTSLKDKPGPKDDSPVSSPTIKAGVPHQQQQLLGQWAKLSCTCLPAIQFSVFFLWILFHTLSRIRNFPCYFKTKAIQRLPRYHLWLYKCCQPRHVATVREFKIQ